jgi:hypothetical protein
MAWSAHRRLAGDASLPLAYRASHARSCALPVANKLAVRRSVVLAHLARRTGVDLADPASADALAQAVASLDARSGPGTRRSMADR